MKKFKHFTASVLLLAALSSISVQAYAQIQEEPTPKEEVVYGSLNSDGSVTSIYVVNSFDLSSEGNILDYGDYSEVKNLNTIDSINYDGQRVTIDSVSGKFNYQGTLKTLDLPWNVSITYSLDGKKISANEIAGKSGKFEMQISFRENSNVDNSYFKNYALQATVTLDTNKCRNISASDATIANVGSNKQITYTILPGNEKSITITADVTDFEMNSISLAGVRLSLDLDLDNEELKSKVEEMVNGVESIDTGAKTISSGVSSLTDGTSKLNSGMSTLSTGLETLERGFNALTSSSSNLTDGSSSVLKALQEINTSLNNLNLKADNINNLITASSSIKEAINTLYNGSAALESSMTYDGYVGALAAKGASITEIRAGNDQAISALEALADTLSAEDPSLYSIQSAVSVLKANNAIIDGTSGYFSSVSSGSKELTSGLSTLYLNYTTYHESISQLSSELGTLTGSMTTLKNAISDLASKYSELDSGLNSYANAVAELAAGYIELVSGAKDLSTATNTLHDGASSLLAGSGSLADGTGELLNGTETFENELSDLDELLDSLTSSDEDIEYISFVSDMNTNVESVQFIIQTTAIEIPASEEIVETQEVTLSFWEKLMQLFGR